MRAQVPWWQRPAVGAPLVALAVLVIVGVVATRSESPRHVAQARPVAQAASSSSPLVDRLRQIADKNASENGGRAVDAQAVLTTRARANRYLSGAVVVQDNPVWVIQVEGNFVCSGCHGLSSPVPAASGHVMQITVDARTFQVSDFGIQDHLTDLSALGNVITLR